MDNQSKSELEESEESQPQPKYDPAALQQAFNKTLELESLTLKKLQMLRELKRSLAREYRKSGAGEIQCEHVFRLSKPLFRSIRVM